MDYIVAWPLIELIFVLSNICVASGNSKKADQSRESPRAALDKLLEEINYYD